jgi:uncharacterized membrane protein
MFSQVRFSKTLHVWSLTALIVSLVMLGIFFRFNHLDYKLYWVDEVFTSLQLSGHTLAEMKRDLVTGKLLSLSTLHHYQYPRSEGTVADPVRVLLAEDTHVPLYYVGLWYWLKLWGNSIAATRSFSSVISLLVFPSTYWLCRELFRSPLSGWLAIALIAVSPIHVLYAQEARPYCLLILITLISSAALLRAVRLSDLKHRLLHWLLYSVAISAGLYTHVLFPFVPIAHGIYLVACYFVGRFSAPDESAKTNQSANGSCIGAYFGAIVLAGLSYTPWLLFHVQGQADLETAMSWTRTQGTFVSAAVRWSGIISRIFFDFGISPDNGTSWNIWLVLPIAFLLLLIATAFKLLYQRTPVQVWGFVLMLTVVPAISFALPDFLLGLRYGTTRYLLPSLVGIQLAVVYLLSSRLEQVWQGKRSQVWQLIIVAIALLGVVSCTLSSLNPLWWNKSPERHRYFPESAALIDQSRRPLVVSDADVIDIQVLGHLLRHPDVKFQLVRSDQLSDQVPKIPTGFSDVFLFKPSDTLRSNLLKRKEFSRKGSSKMERLIQPLWRVSLLQADRS